MAEVTRQDVDAPSCSFNRLCILEYILALGDACWEHRNLNSDDEVFSVLLHDRSCVCRPKFGAKEEKSQAQRLSH